eukprot:938039-Pelagomonas_calceolata.AAC.1
MTSFANCSNHFTQPCNWPFFLTHTLSLSCRFFTTYHHFAILASFHKLFVHPTSSPLTKNVRGRDLGAWCNEAQDVNALFDDQGGKALAGTLPHGQLAHVAPGCSEVQGTAEDAPKLPASGAGKSDEATCFSRKSYIGCAFMKQSASKASTRESRVR